MAEIITSIGTRSAENVDISSVSGTGPYTVTLSGAPSTTNIGDTLTDEAASPNNYLITGISGADLTVTDSFGAATAPSAAGATQATTIRTYSTMTAWEADLDDTDLYSASDDATGQVYNDAAFAEGFTIDGGGTVGLTSITLEAASGEEHDGTAGTGARIESSSAAHKITSNSPQPCIIRALEIDGNGQTIQFGIQFGAGTAQQAERCIIHDGSQNTTGGGIHFNGFTNDKYALNSIVYDWDVTGGSTNGHGGISGREAFDSHHVINCTVYNVLSTGTTDGYGIHIKDDVDNTVRNCISVSCADADYETSSYVNTVSSNNIASDGNVPGSDSHGSESAGSLFVSTSGGSEDLHLASGATNAIDGGTDLGTTPSGVEIDIDGRDRDAQGDTWDIGADEYVAAASTFRPHIVMIH